MSKNIKMVNYLDEPVPEETCTINRFGEADDFIGCGNCEPIDNMCDNCVVDKIFKEYARLTNQLV